MIQTIVSETLYRKYRPASFADVLGQSAVVDALEQQVKNGSIAHAYLFSGGRGTGKTSIARIFARQLGTGDEDIIEIDAASNRGIGEIRELKAGVDTRPFSSDYKVYIIDEVHMLTKEAFNALLKTLEEPPSHAIFILATTEKQKVLDTILSRCQVFDFKLAIHESLVELVNKVVAREGCKIDSESADYIAKLGNGSFRDTLSHLQKVLAVCDKKIEAQRVLEIFGEGQTGLELQLLEALSNGDQDAVFSAYHKILDAGTDIRGLVERLLAAVRTVIMLRYSKDFAARSTETIAADTLAAYQNMPGITSHTLRDLLAAYESLLSSARPQDSFEVFLFEKFDV